MVLTGESLLIFSEKPLETSHNPFRVCSFQVTPSCPDYEEAPRLGMIWGGGKVKRLPLGASMFWNGSSCRGRTYLHKDFHREPETKASCKRSAAVGTRRPGSLQLRATKRPSPANKENSSIISIGQDPTCTLNWGYMVPNGG